MNSGDIGKAMKYRWLIFTILSLCYILVYFHRLCPAVLAVDIMRDLKAGGAITGFLAAAYFYPYATMQLPAGLLSDSWGPRKTITLFFIIAFAGSIILGMASNATWAIAGRTLVGFGVAMLFVPTMKILAEWFHAREFGVYDRNPDGNGGCRLTFSGYASRLAQFLGGVAVFLYRRGRDYFGSGCSGLDFRQKPPL